MQTETISLGTTPCANAVLTLARVTDESFDDWIWQGVKIELYNVEDDVRVSFVVNQMEALDIVRALDRVRPDARRRPPTEID